jgi:hypothetical protein
MIIEAYMQDETKFEQTLPILRFPLKIQVKNTVAGRFPHNVPELRRAETTNSASQLEA